MFSQTAEYALRAVVALGRVEPTPLTTEKIAQVTRVPRAYLAKVLQALVRGGVLLSHRGVRGGLSLARPVDDISILDVIEAVDPIKRITSCPLGIAAHGTKLCPLHSKLDGVLEEVAKTFESCSVGQMLETPKIPPPFCRFPLFTTEMRGMEKS